MLFDPPSSSDTMWSISSVEPYGLAASPYSISTWCFSDSGTLRIVPVWKLAEQMTGFDNPLEYAPGEHRRSGSAPTLHALVLLRGASKTVVPTLGVLGSEAPVSHAATPPWWEHVPERCWEKLYVPSLQRAVAPFGEAPATALPAVAKDTNAARTQRRRTLSAACPEGTPPSRGASAESKRWTPGDDFGNAGCRTRIHAAEAKAGVRASSDHNVR
jgi:hypothetical protein